MSGPPCPSIERLNQVLNDELLPEEAAKIENHVEHCTLCQATLERLNGDATRDGLGAVTMLDEARIQNLVKSPVGSTQNLTPTDSDQSTFETTLDDRLPEIPGYVIERELGRGGMGVVYFGWQIHANRPVALKMLLDGRNRSEDLLRFRLEGESLARLQSPNVVQVYEVGISNGRPFFSMEYVSGGTLADAFATERFTIKESVAIIETIARGVHSAHQCGVVHRDLKPSNILVAKVEGSSSGSNQGILGSITPKVTDFGLAKHVGNDSSLTQTGQILGTPNYMAPEQATGGANVGVLADVYALGAILYEALTGRPPFKAANPWETMMLVVHETVVSPKKWQPSLPRDLEVICLKCLSKDPNARYSSADALANDLSHFLKGESILARPAGLRRRSWLWCRRRPVQATLTSLLLLSILAGVVGITIQWRRSERLLERSKRRFDLALDAIQTYYSGTSRDVLMKQPELKELRTKLLRTPLSFYEKLRNELEMDVDDDPESLLQLADVFLNLAKLNREVGNKVDAREAYRQAEIAARPLTDGFSASRPFANGSYWIGRFGSIASKSAERPLANRARTIVAWSRTRGGEIDSETGRLDVGRKELESAIVDFQWLRAGEPNEPEHVNGLAMSHHLLGDIACDQARFDDSEQLYQEALRLRRELVAKYPENRSYLDGLGGTENNFAILYGQWHKDQKAGEYFLKGLEDRETLAKLEPGEPEYQRKLSSSLNNYGSFCQNSNHISNASEYEMRAMEIQRKLVKEHPTFSLYQFDLAVSFDTVAKLDMILGRFDSARSNYLQALELLEKLTKENPNTLAYQLSLINAISGLGDVSLCVDDYPNALARFTRAVAVCDALPRELAKDSVCQTLRANAKLGQGAAHEIKGEARLAALDYQEALSNFDALLKNGGHAEEQNHAATAFARVAQYRIATGEFDAAAAALSTARRLLKQLIDAEPSSARYLTASSALDALEGRLLLYQGRSQQDPKAVGRALQLSMKAIEGLSKALADNPEAADVKSILIEARADHAEVLTSLGSYDEAAQEWEGVIKEAAPKNRTRYKASQALTLARSGKRDEAVLSADTIMRESGLNLETYLNLAKVYAIASKDPSKAMDELRKGLADTRSGDGRLVLEQLNDPAFDSLRATDEFKDVKLELSVRSPH